MEWGHWCSLWTLGIKITTITVVLTSCQEPVVVFSRWASESINHLWCRASQRFFPMCFYGTIQRRSGWMLLTRQSKTRLNLAEGCNDICCIYCPEAVALLQLCWQHHLNIYLECGSCSSSCLPLAINLSNKTVFKSLQLFLLFTSQMGFEMKSRNCFLRQELCTHFKLFVKWIKKKSETTRKRKSKSPNDRCSARLQILYLFPFSFIFQQQLGGRKIKCWSNTQPFGEKHPKLPVKLPPKTAVFTASDQTADMNSMKNYFKIKEFISGVFSLERPQKMARCFWWNMNSLYSVKSKFLTAQTQILVYWVIWRINTWIQIPVCPVYSFQSREKW